jgi:hypothetical protein
MKRKNKLFWIGLIVIFIVLYFYGDYKEEWEEENCDLTFNTYTYNEGCASACSTKCYDEGFEYTSSAYFEPYLSYEEMMDYGLYKRCGCNCGGCRK